jgi:ABC-type methionine transport system ATPase subunit
MKTIEKVRFTFLDKLIKEPVIHKVGRDFNVVTNIRRADIQDGIGWVILEIEGDQQSIEDAMEWVRSLGVRVDPAVGDVVEG